MRPLGEMRERVHRRRDARSVGDRVEDRLAVASVRPLEPDLAADRADPLRREQHEQAPRCCSPREPPAGALSADPAGADRASDGHGSRGDDPVVVLDRVLEVIGREQVERRGGDGDEQPARHEQAQPARREDEHREDPELGRAERLVDRRQGVPDHELDRVRERVAPDAGEAWPELVLRGVPERREHDEHGDRRPRGAPDGEPERRGAVGPTRPARARARRT